MKYMLKAIHCDREIEALMTEGSDTTEEIHPILFKVPKIHTYVTHFTLRDERGRDFHYAMLYKIAIPDSDYNPYRERPKPPIFFTYGDGSEEAIYDFALWLAKQPLPFNMKEDYFYKVVRFYIDSYMRKEEYKY